MKSTHLATRMCATVLPIVLFGMLSACSDKNADSAAPTVAPPETSAVTPVEPAKTAAESKGIAYVSNQDGAVTIIDLNTMETTGSIDIQATGPRGIGITDDGKLLVTANKDQGNISVIDTSTGKLVQHVDIGKNPEFVRVIGNKAFVSFEPSSEGGPPPKPGTEKKADKEDDDDSDEPARIAIVDLISGKKLTEIVGGPETEGIELSKNGENIIITNEADNTITVHNIANGELVKTIPTKEWGQRPRGIKISPDGETYVSTLEFGNNFLVMDKDFKPVRAVATAEGPYGISFDRSGKHIYVADSKAKLLEVFDAKTYEKVKEVATGSRCWHFTFTPDDKQILLACGKSDEVLVIDAEKLEVTKHIADKKLPWGVVAYPKSMGSLDAPN